MVVVALVTGTQQKHPNATIWNIGTPQKGSPKCGRPYISPKSPSTIPVSMGFQGFDLRTRASKKGSPTSDLQPLLGICTIVKTPYIGEWLLRGMLGF